MSYNPILQRQVYQPSLSQPSGNTAIGNTAAQAKGTGITSMVTSPDSNNPNDAAKILKSMANPVSPTVGYAGGGEVQRFQQGGDVGVPVASMWDRFVNSLTVKEPDRSGNYRLPDVGLRIGRNDEFRKDAGIMSASAPTETIDIGGPQATYDPRFATQESVNNPEPGNETIERPGMRGMARVNPVTTQGERVPAEHPRDEYLRLEAEARSREEQQRRAEIDRMLESEQESRRAAGFRGIGSLPPPSPPPPAMQIPEEKKATGEISTNLANIKSDREAKSSADRRENALLALMNAGFAMAAGKSPHALQNIGAGGQAGVQTFAELEKGRRESEHKQYLQDLHERELAMRQQEQDIKAPLYKAQADYYKARPDIEADKIAARERMIVSRAEADAQKAVDAAEAKNPMAFYGPNGKPDPLAKDLAKSKYLQMYKRQYSDLYRSGIGSAERNPLGLETPE